MALLPLVHANEVVIEPQTSVVVREHPQSGKPYISVVFPHSPARKIFYGAQKKFKKPDYRLLDPRVNSKNAGYDGPVSDRKKVYALAAVLAVGGAAAYAALPAAASAGGAAGGAGLYAAASGAVTAGTFSAHWAMSGTDRPDDFTQSSVSRELGGHSRFRRWLASHWEV